MNPYLFRLYQAHRYAKTSQGRMYRQWNVARTSAERTAYQLDELKKGH